MSIRTEAQRQAEQRHAKADEDSELRDEFVAGAVWQASRNIEVTDELVTRFKAAWHEADKRGEAGSRVRRALSAVLGGGE